MNDASFRVPGETQALIDGYFEDVLSAEEASRLERLVATDPAVALALARAGLFADRLHGVLATDGVARGVRADAAEPRAPVTTRSALRRVVAVVAALALAVVVAVLLRQSSGTAAAAGVALDRIVTAAASTGDREYRIHVLDHGPHGRPAPVPSGGQGRKPGIDGARLFVRGADRFVLIRRFGDGSEFVTGSDGTIGWSVPPRGHVHLSDDVRRFRRAVPGEHEEVPFIDLRGGLDGLRRGYDLSLSAGADGVRTLHAVLQPGRRGVERVNVWFDDAGVATRIVIEGLPADEGAPRAVELELVSTRDPGDAFFGHEAHHAAGRPTQWE